jgi:hypothetical protein
MLYFNIGGVMIKVVIKCIASVVRALICFPRKEV